jgi:hypothetical protein
MFPEQGGQTAIKQDLEVEITFQRFLSFPGGF